jgi:hypothetical protein
VGAPPLNRADVLRQLGTLAAAAKVRYAMEQSIVYRDYVR